MQAGGQLDGLQVVGSVVLPLMQLLLPPPAPEVSTKPERLTWLVVLLYINCHQLTTKLHAVSPSVGSAGFPRPAFLIACAHEAKYDTASGLVHEEFHGTSGM